MSPRAVIRSWAWTPVAAAMVCGLTSACTAPTRATTPRPAVPDPNDGDQTCRETAVDASPWAIEMGELEQASLEQSMRGGVAVVRFACGRLRVLADCHAVGTYGYSGLTRREEVQHFVSLNELTVAIPTLVELPASLSLQRDAKLEVDLATAVVGRRRTTVQGVTEEDLFGKCDGATHVVRGAWVGAFSLSESSKASTGGAVELLGLRLGAKTGASNLRVRRGGDLGACPAGPGPARAGCGALLRLDLSPVARASHAPRAGLSCPAGFLSYQGRHCMRADSGKVCPAGVDQCVASCSKGVAAACYVAGNLFHEGIGVDRDLRRSLELSRRACELGDLHGCNNYAVSLGPRASSDATIPLFRRACDGGVDVACDTLGAHYAKGQGVRKDPALAEALFARGCDGGWGPACANLGVLMSESGNHAVAAQAHERACLGGVGPSCSISARQLLDGDLTVARRERTFSVASRGCRLSDHRSCNILGVHYEDGIAVAKDPARAASLYGQACAGELGVGCTNLGRLHQAGAGVALNEAEAFEQFKRGCRLGDPGGCALAAFALLDGLGVARDDQAALAMVKKPCAEGSVTACAAKAEVLLTGGPKVRDTKAAAALGQSACDKNDAHGCAVLGVAHAERRSTADAFAALRRACSLKSARGCRYLGSLARSSNRPDEAREAFRAGCALRDRASCDFVDPKR